MIPYDESKIWFMHLYPIQAVQEALKDIDVRVICFGSTIKGTATWRSDIDLAYEAKDIETAKLAHKLINRIELDIEYPQIAYDLIPLRLVKPTSDLLQEINNGMIIVDYKGGS